MVAVETQQILTQGFEFFVLRLQAEAETDQGDPSVRGSGADLFQGERLPAVQFQRPVQGVGQIGRGVGEGRTAPPGCPVFRARQSSFSLLQATM